MRCHPWQRETLIQAVKKVKSAENAVRKRMGDLQKFPVYGRLKIVWDKDSKTVTFSLSYFTGDML